MILPKIQIQNNLPDTKWEPQICVLVSGFQLFLRIAAIHLLLFSLASKKIAPTAC